MTRMPIEISVIVPVYNLKHYIRKCIESLRRQTFQSYEVILVDDGSVDGSEKIVEEYASDPRFTIKHIANSGVSVARNTGLELARGRYIAFVDGDDYVKSDYLATLHSAAQQQACDIAVCGKIIDTGATFPACALQHTGVFQGNEKLVLLQEMLGYSFKDIKVWLKDRDFSRGTTVWARLYRAELLRHNRIRFAKGVKIGEDMLFNAEAYLCADKIVQIPYCGYYYVKRVSSAMHEYTTKVDCDALLKNKCCLAVLRDAICEKRISDAALKHRVKSMYEGSLILSCAEIAVSLAKSKEKSILKKNRLYRTYSTLPMVAAARKKFGLAGIRLRYAAALLLIKWNRSYPLLAGLSALEKVGIDFKA